ncbi:hypothetical protein [Anthocerotibacter panamensis]|uniref:hypothetical protein n=1 Tax=Anthocerotibacter panamensis TaxID=2857077 RepID=UPI001C4058BE|nr:hypothetical protein [Anthocerotibacter panamensis]
MPVLVDLTKRRLIFWSLTVLTIGSGVLAGIWMAFSLVSRTVVSAFGQDFPQWVLPAFILYLASRNAVRLWRMREGLLKGDGNFDLSGSLFARFQKSAPPANGPGPNRTQRRQAARKR